MPYSPCTYDILLKPYKFSKLLAISKIKKLQFSKFSNNLQLTKKNSITLRERKKERPDSVIFFLIVNSMNYTLLQLHVVYNVEVLEFSEGSSNREALESLMSLEA